MTNTLESLTAEYAAWLNTENRRAPPVTLAGSADELLAEIVQDRDIATARYDWLRDFCLRWDIAQAAESDAARFEKWRAQRKWFYDVRDDTPDETAAGPGYCYPCGFLMLNTGPRQDLGRYWAPLGQLEAWGDLDTVERALWEEHVRHEWNDR